MSLRMRMIEIKADWDVWETRLAAATGVLLAASSLANVGRFFSVHKAPTLLGACLSWLYLGAWFLGAVLLRDREHWVRRTRAVRWIAVLSILLGLAVGTQASVNPVSSLFTLPYALFVAVYFGLPPMAWLYYAMALVQAVTASLLARRLRRRKKAAEDAERAERWGDL